eukprot:TRINITY_DN12261_c0_g1_i2.p1 TRINITY_DN12261_c0_g1~~TRINITY_DN12261_c0_g1_i2.p1  ORF type:complete len:348 (+),score=116.16 TRINITY_DN12261_c0_g1_i2:38-1081(+)
MSSISMLSPHARAMLEELEGELSSGHNEKPRQILRAMPTQLLSDIDQVYEETRQRTELKMSQVHQRTSVCDENLRAVGERRRELIHEQQECAQEIADQITILREALVVQERALNQQLVDMVRAKEAELDEQHDDLARRREKLVDMYNEADDYMKDGLSHKYEFIQGTHAMEGKMDAHICLNLDVNELDLSLAKEVPFPEAAQAIARLAFDTSAPSPSRPVDREVLHQQVKRVEQQRAEQSVSPVRPPPAQPKPASVASPKDAVPNAVYVNGLAPETSEAEIRQVFEHFGEIKMVNARHVSNGGFAFVFFKTEQGAANALENPRVEVGERTVNILAKKQILSGGGRWL